MLHRITSGSVLAVLLLAVASCSTPPEPAAEPVVLPPPAQPVEPIAAEPKPVEPTAVETVAVESTQPQPTDVGSDEPAPVEPVGPEVPEAHEVIVSLGDNKLTMEHIEWKTPDPPDYHVARLANSWVETQLLFAEAEKRGLSNDPRARFLADMMHKNAIVQVLREQVENSVEGTDQQVRAYYEENKESDRSLQQPGNLSFSHVRSKTLEEAKKVFERIKAGEDINALAKELSTHADRAKDGRVEKAPHAMIERGFGHDFLEELQEAKEGQVIGPIELERNRGFEVARKDGEIKPKPMPFEEVKDRIKSTVERLEKRKAFEALRDSLIEQAGDKIVKSQRLIEAEKSKPPSRPPLTGRRSRMTRPRPAPRRVEPTVPEMIRRPAEK
ncbi:MAG: peptidyl-prolyl cis-trans isomerase [Planctomycetota bacterium]|jgi:hypothetical protein